MLKKQQKSLNAKDQLQKYVPHVTCLFKMKQEVIKSFNIHRHYFLNNVRNNRFARGEKRSQNNLITHYK